MKLMITFMAFLVQFALAQDYYAQTLGLSYSGEESIISTIQLDPSTGSYTNITTDLEYYGSAIIYDGFSAYNQDEGIYYWASDTTDAFIWRTDVNKKETMAPLVTYAQSVIDMWYDNGGKMLYTILYAYYQAPSSTSGYYSSTSGYYSSTSGYSSSTTGYASTSGSYSSSTGRVLDKDQKGQDGGFGFVPKSSQKNPLKKEGYGEGFFLMALGGETEQEIAFNTTEMMHVSGDGNGSLYVLYMGYPFQLSTIDLGSGSQTYVDVQCEFESNNMFYFDGYMVGVAFNETGGYFDYYIIAIDVETGVCDTYTTSYLDQADLVVAQAQGYSNSMLYYVGFADMVQSLVAFDPSTKSNEIIGNFTVPIVSIGVDTSSSSQ